MRMKHFLCIFGLAILLWGCSQTQVRESQSTRPVEQTPTHISAYSSMQDMILQVFAYSNAVPQGPVQITRITGLEPLEMAVFQVSTVKIFLKDGAVHYFDNDHIQGFVLPRTTPPIRIEALDTAGTVIASEPINFPP